MRRVDCASAGTRRRQGPESYREDRLAHALSLSEAATETRRKVRAGMDLAGFLSLPPPNRGREVYGVETLASPPPRQMHLGLFILGTGSHVAGWRYPGAVTDFTGSRRHPADRAHRRARAVRPDLHGRQPLCRSRRASVLHAAARAAHHDGGAGDHDAPHRARRHRLDDLRRSLEHRPRLRLARPYQRRARRLERGHHHQSGSGRQFRQGAARPRRPLCARRGVHRGGDEAVGRLGRRRAGRRPRHRRLSRSGEAARHRPCRPTLQGEGPGQYRPRAAGPADRAAGRRLGARPGAGSAHRRRGLHRDPGHRGIEGRLQGGEGADAGVRPRAGAARHAAGRDAGGRPHRQGGAREARDPSVLRRFAQRRCSSSPTGWAST